MITNIYYRKSTNNFYMAQHAMQAVKLGISPDEFEEIGTVYTPSIDCSARFRKESKEEDLRAMVVNLLEMGVNPAKISVAKLNRAIIW